MTIDITGVLADAWAMFKRDRDLLLRVAGPFLFLPQLAVLLLVQPPELAATVAGRPATMDTVLTVTAQWYADNGLSMVSAALFVEFGTLALYVLYLYRDRPDVRGALLAALRLLPQYLLLSILVMIAYLVGFSLFILPLFYLMGRLMLVTPALVAEQPLGVIGALGRSLKLSEGRGLVLAGIAVMLAMIGYLLPEPFLALGKALDGAPISNPVSAMLLDAGAAAATTLVTLGAILIKVAIYRRLAVPSRGI